MNCIICGTELNGRICPRCGIDYSQNREQHPTLADDNMSLDSIASLRCKWEKQQKTRSMPTPHDDRKDTAVAAQSDSTVPTAESTPKPVDAVPEGKKRKKTAAILAGTAAGLLLLGGGLLALKNGVFSGKDNDGATADFTPGSQKDWTLWADELPEQVTADDYLIEERTVYSNRKLETTSSTTSNKMNGWELYDTLAGNGEYGRWSDWSETAVSDSDTRKVETKTRYRYSDKETTTGSSQSMNGWTLENTTYNWSDYGAWSNWSENEAIKTDSRDVQTQTQYSYRDKETTSSSASSLSGWTQYNEARTWGDYGSWSDWTTNLIEETESKKVQTKTQYRYRDWIYTSSDNGNLSGWTCYDIGTSYGSWSDWGDSYISETSARQVETRDVEDGKSYYFAHYCTGNVPGAQWKTYPTNRSADETFNANCTYHELGWFDSLSKFEYRHTIGGYEGYIYYPNGRYDCSNSCWTWYLLNTSVNYKTQYRYRNIYYTYYYMKQGDWSSWSDDYAAPSGDREVETRTLYRYCTRDQIVTYYFYRWKDWSSWSSTPVSGNDLRQVQTRTLYSYRDRSSVPVYHFYRWKDWSDWSDNPYTDSNTRKVETKTFYRFCDRVTQTTYYFRRWTDWSDYSESPAQPSETVEVQTKTQYRYKSKDANDASMTESGGSPSARSTEAVNQASSVTQAETAALDSPKPEIHTYEFIRDNCTWEEAQRKAVELGGHLACFETKEEAEYVLLLMDETKQELCYMRVGARRELDGTAYYWVDRNNQFYGEQINAPDSWCATFWGDGEPSYSWNDNPETCCMVLYNSNLQKWILNDINNTISDGIDPETVGFIVEYEP